MPMLSRFTQSKLYQFLQSVYEAILKRMLRLPPRVYGITLVLVALAAGLVAIEAIATAMAFAVVGVVIFSLYGLAVAAKRAWRAAFKSTKGSPQALVEGEVLLSGNSGGGRFRQFLSALYGLILQRILGLPPTLIGALLVLAGFAGAVIAIEAIATLLLVGALGVLTFAIYGIGLLILAGWRAFHRHRASTAQERERHSDTTAAQQSREEQDHMSTSERDLQEQQHQSSQVPVPT